MNFSAYYSTFTAKLHRLVFYICVAIIKLYQYGISPLKPHSTCCFLPTCSQYAIDALHSHGVFKGGLLAVRRIMRCHSKHDYTIDEVPK